MNSRARTRGWLGFQWWHPLVIVWAVIAATTEPFRSHYWLAVLVGVLGVFSLGFLWVVILRLIRKHT